MTTTSHEIFMSINHGRDKKISHIPILGFMNGSNCIHKGFLDTTEKDDSNKKQ